MLQPPRALQQLLQSIGEAPCQAPDPPAWGFSLSHVTLQQLQQHHDSRPEDEDEATAADTYLNKLETDHTFASNHCVAAMAQQLGLAQYTDCLSGTLQAAAAVLPDAAGADAALTAVRQHIDAAWSKEAVWRGVGFAKQGDYQQAIECYNKALALNPSNCDAHVARGAAHANQGQFEAALQDFSAALRIDPGNVNAVKYLQATNKHMEAAAPAQQQQQQHAGLARHGREVQTNTAHLQQQQPQHRQEQQQQRQQHQQLLQEQTRQHRHASRSRSRGISRGRRVSRGRGRSPKKRSTSSSSGSSSSTSGSSSEGDEGGPSKVSKAVDVDDIREAIQVLRSEAKHKRKEHSKHTKKSRGKHHKRSSKHRKHKRSKHKQKK